MPLARLPLDVKELAVCRYELAVVYGVNLPLQHRVVCVVPRRSLCTPLNPKWPPPAQSLPLTPAGHFVPPGINGELLAQLEAQGPPLRVPPPLDLLSKLC